MGGTYGISWELTPSDINEDQSSGSQNFDVAGLVVKVAKSVLEKGKYSPGDAVRATLTFESNQNTSVELRSWITSPTGEWKYNGSMSITLSETSHIDIINSGVLDTTEAGTHNFVYGLYSGDKLVVSGSLAFDVGDAVLLGITTDQFEYKTGSENVNLKVEYFGEGTASLELYLDDELYETRSVTLQGVGFTIITLNSGSISGGSHSLKVLLKKDGLTSEKTTGFIYGTSLPDLSISVVELNKDNLSYTYRLAVSNSGKTASSPSTIVFSDNGIDVASQSVPQLEPGLSSEHIFNWSGSGKAGDHEFIFTVDKNNSLKEFNEENNSLTFTESIPEVFYSLRVEPEIWKANTDVSIISYIINNRDSQTSFTLDLSIISELTGDPIFERTKNEEYSAFENKIINDVFQTGVFPAGEYRVIQTLGSVSEDLTEEVYVVIEPTKSINVAFQIVPESISPDIDSDVEMTIDLSNIGNVILEDEVLIIEVTKKDEQDILNTSEIVFSLELAEQKEMQKIISLNLEEGIYEIKLKFIEEIVSQKDLIVTGGLEKEKRISLIPRVLLMNLHPIGLNSSGLNLIASIINGANIKYDVGSNLINSYLNFLKTENNINMIFNKLNPSSFKKEIIERVHRGEALIIFADKVINDNTMRDFLGVRIRTLPKKQRETEIEISHPDFNSNGDIFLQEEAKYYIEKINADVEIVGKTKINKNPVVAFRRYGNGNILIVSHPLNITSGGQVFSSLILNGILQFNKDVYSYSDLERIVPVELALKNNTSETREYIIKEILPYGVKTFGYDPEPEEGDELKWKINISGNSDVFIRYWIQLPDSINTYEIKSEIYSGETKIDEAAISFDVLQTVIARIDEIIIEIDSIQASGGDMGKLNSVKELLQAVRNRDLTSVMNYIYNLRDTRNALFILGKVSPNESVLIRTRVQMILTIMERRLYDKLKELNFPMLNNLL